MSESSFNPKRFVSGLTSRPGVYQMLGSDGEVLYVGKAKNLKKRVASYFLRASGSTRIESMVDQIHDIAIHVTDTENQALLLESSLIKRHRPRYNIVFRDDKSYPYLVITGDHAYPRIRFHRGSRKKPHRYFGPYPNAGSVRRTLDSLQKLFQLRPCSDSFFANRSRPCLQHQIKRCSAPCVQAITEDAYADDVADAVRLLEGKSEVLVRKLTQRMEAASEALDFERAARYRDQIAALRTIQGPRDAAGSVEDADFVVLEQRAGLTAVGVGTIRNSQHLGYRSFFPKGATDAERGEVLTAFLGQYYAERPPPREIVVTDQPEEAELLQQALGAASGRRVQIKHQVRGTRARVLRTARDSLQEAIAARLLQGEALGRRYQALGELLGLDETPGRLECFDISHTRGESPVASCVVFDEDGPLKAAYRRFNMKDVTPGDDYAAIRQAVLRRFRRLKEGEAPVPDVLLIDGGKGQLAQAVEAVEEAGVTGVTIISVAKGADRRVGLEQIFRPDVPTAMRPPPGDPGLHLIQQIRDEAHRFAIEGHRGQRNKARKQSVLEEIEGLGPRRRQALLRSFGGLQRVERAGVDELARVEGISRKLAQRIYDRFHS